MKLLSLFMAIFMLTLVACHNPKTAAWICPECGCKEGSGCGCSHDNGCQCKDGKCQCT